jgi:hypothetical protein
MGIIISPKIRTKLATKPHPVSQQDIEECFSTRDRGFLQDSRENNKTMPPTQWFISDTFIGRLLKIVFIQMDDGSIVIKTAYDPNTDEKRIYHKYSVELDG